MYQQYAAFQGKLYALTERGFEEVVDLPDGWREILNRIMVVEDLY